jgi:hypothetical protein
MARSQPDPEGHHLAIVARVAAVYLKHLTAAVFMPLGIDAANSLSAIVVAKLIEGNAVLTTPDISLNGIDKEGGIAFAEALKFNAVLKSLDIGGNHISNVGGIAFAEALYSLNNASIVRGAGGAGTRSCTVHAHTDTPSPTLSLPTPAGDAGRRDRTAKRLVDVPATAHSSSSLMQLTSRPRSRRPRFWPRG